MKLQKILDFSGANDDWEELSHSTLREASRSHLRVESIHIQGSEVILEGEHSFDAAESEIL